MITKKYLINVNKKIGESGKLINDNLDFIVDYSKYNIPKGLKLKRLTYLVTSIINLHPFVDGNKRTCCFLITEYFKERKISYDEDKIIKICISIAKNKIRSIKIGKEMIRNAIE